MLITIEGNERTDKAAKLAHSSPDVNISSLSSYSDIKNVIKMDTLRL